MTVKWTRIYAKGGAYESEDIGYCVRRHPHTGRWEVWPWYASRGVAGFDRCREAKRWAERNAELMNRLQREDVGAYLNLAEVGTGLT